MKEHLFTCTSGFSEVYGIVHPTQEDRNSESDLCVIILNSGMTHRVGPHRLGVRLARRLVDQGVAAARFDFSGVGNTDVRKDGKSIKDQWLSQCQEVMELLEKDWGYRRFVLLGLCAGGQLSFASAARDQRVVGAILINTHDYELDDNWGEYASLERDAHFYWRRAAFRKYSWKRLLTGKSSFKKIGTAIKFQVRERFRPSKTLHHAKDWFAGQLNIIQGHGSCLLFLYSKGDPGWDQLRLLVGQKDLTKYSSDQNDGPIKVTVISDADHTFTMRHTQEDILGLILDWMAGFEDRFQSAKKALG
jgi:pimeloyl-ACP methyl ester carboxylesterase